MAGGRKRPNAVSAVRIYDPDFMETKPVKLPVKLITKQMDFKSSDHSAGVKSKSSKSLPLQAPPAATQLDQSSDDQLSSPKSGPWTPPQIMKRIVKRSSIEALKSISDVRKREEGKRPAKVRRGNFQSIAVASPPSKTAARKTKLHLADDIPLPTKYAETLTSGSKKLASVLASSEPLAKSMYATNIDSTCLKTDNSPATTVCFVGPAMKMRGTLIYRNSVSLKTERQSRSKHWPNTR
jgi:hypothetical protein